MTNVRLKKMQRLYKCIRELRYLDKIREVARTPEEFDALVRKYLPELTAKS